MKSYIDFFETFKGEMLGAKRFRNRFYRRWGTETIDGVEVMKSRFTIYPGHMSKNPDGTFTTNANNIQNMCKMLGSWSQVKEANFNAIAGYYFWLNPNKGDTSELSNELLAEKVDLFCPKGQWQNATINYVDKVDPTKFEGWTKEQILEYIDEDYRNIFSQDNGFVVEEQLVQRAMGKYVLFDDGTEFEVEILSSSIAAIEHTAALTLQIGRNKKMYHTGLSVEIRYKRIVNDIDPEGLLITSMLEEQEEARLEDLRALQSSQQGPFYSDTDWISAVPKTVTNELWYKNQLRVSAIKAEGIRTSIAIDAILSTLDTGQIQKKVKWYKKVLGFVLIIIAIALAAPTGGASWSLATVALYVGVAVMIMTVIQAKWAKSNAAAASYMGRFVKIGNIISMVAGIGAMYQAFAKEALKQAVATEMAKQAGTEAAAQVARTTVQSMSQSTVTQLATSMGVEVTTQSVITTAGNMIMGSWKSIAMKVVAKAVEMRQESMQADLQNKTSQLEESEEALKDMMDKNLPIGIKDIEWYTDLSGTAQSRYDVNYLYEAEPKGLHVGNICRASFYNGKGLNLRAEDLV